MSAHEPHEHESRGWRLYIGGSVTALLLLLAWGMYSITQLQVQVAQVQASVSAVPDLTRALTHNQATIAVLQERIAENQRELRRLENVR